MSGGAWGYQEHRILELGWELDKIKRFLEAVAKTEHIVDWSESGDTGRHGYAARDGRWVPGAEEKLYDLWRDTFNEIYDDSR